MKLHERQAFMLEGLAETYAEQWNEYHLNALRDSAAALRKLEALRAAAELHLKKNPGGDQEWLLVRAIEASR